MAKAKTKTKTINTQQGVIDELKKITIGCGGSLVAEIDQLIVKIESEESLSTEEIKAELLKIVHGHGGGMAHSVTELANQL